MHVFLGVTLSRRLRLSHTPLEPLFVIHGGVEILSTDKLQQPPIHVIGFHVFYRDRGGGLPHIDVWLSVA